MKRTSTQTQVHLLFTIASLLFASTVAHSQQLPSDSTLIDDAVRQFKETQYLRQNRLDLQKEVANYIPFTAEVTTYLRNDTNGILTRSTDSGGFTRIDDFHSENFIDTRVDVGYRPRIGWLGGGVHGRVTALAYHHELVGSNFSEFDNLDTSGLILNFGGTYHLGHQFDGNSIFSQIVEDLYLEGGITYNVRYNGFFDDFVYSSWDPYGGLAKYFVVSDRMTAYAGYRYYYSQGISPSKFLKWGRHEGRAGLSYSIIEDKLRTTLAYDYRFYDPRLRSSHEWQALNLNTRFHINKWLFLDANVRRDWREDNFFFSSERTSFDGWEFRVGPGAYFRW